MRRHIDRWAEKFIEVMDLIIDTLVGMFTLFIRAARNLGRGLRCLFMHRRSWESAWYSEIYEKKCARCGQGWHYIYDPNEDKF